jgi:hypothetical protein
MSVADASFNAWPAGVPDTPAGALSMMVRLDEARPMVFRGRAVGPQEMAVARSGAGFECVCRAGARFVVVSLPQREVVRCASDLWHEPSLLAHSPDRLRFADSARFAAQYRQRYGEVPSATLRRVLGEPPVNGSHRDGTWFTGPTRC